MSPNTFNPWVSRFDGLLDLETIRQRASVRADPILGLKDYHPEVAGTFLERALERVYIPTDQACDLLRYFVETALAHSIACYPSVEEFRTECFKRKAELPETTSTRYPICLTGLGGQGKTKLLAALRRVLPPITKASVDSRDSEYPFICYWHIQVKEKKSLTKLLERVLTKNGAVGFPCNDLSALLGACYKHTYQSGTSLLTVDETQFLAKSEKASTLITNFLMNFGMIGVPTVYACNYSLLHKLKRRPHQERQRLLARPVVLEQDSPDSHSWRDLIGEYRKVAPELLQLDFENHLELLYQLSGGIGRALVHLIGLAYRLSRDRSARVIGKCDIEKAYLSSSFTVYREDVEELRRMAISTSMPKGRTDLWCPIPTFSPGKAAVKTNAEKQRSTQVAEARLRASLTPEERQAYDEVVKQRSSKQPTNNLSRNVVPMIRRSKLTVAELRENAKAFREQLEKDD